MSSYESSNRSEGFKIKIDLLSKLNKNHSLLLNPGSQWMKNIQIQVENVPVVDYSRRFISPHTSKFRSLKTVKMNNELKNSVMRKEQAQ